MKKTFILFLILASLFALSGCYTREDIDTIRYNAWEEGYQEGWAEGNMDGYEQGFETGKESGYDEGSYDGYQEGYADALYEYDIEE